MWRSSACCVNTQQAAKELARYQAVSARCSEGKLAISVAGRGSYGLGRTINPPPPDGIKAKGKIHA